MRRREFIALVSGAATAWPLSARAQQTDRMRRIGVLLGVAAEDSDTKARLTAFLNELQRLGWTDGRNVRIDIRTGALAELRGYASELVGRAPDVILATGSTLARLFDETHTVPIVFTLTIDPVGGGIVASLARPGGNVTGFMSFEYSLSGKWLELVKEVAPGVTRAAVLRDPTVPAGTGQFAVIQAVAPSLDIDVSAINVRDAREIEQAVAAFATAAHGGLVVTSSPWTVIHRDLIVMLAARHNLPTVYWDSTAVTGGGLISYGPDFVDQFRRAAGYVDRILRAEKPADLPVQAPTKYQLAINLKTAKALGLTIPPAVLARADDVIE